jgi:thiamine-monophosphate kinase
MVERIRATLAGGIGAPDLSDDAAVVQVPGDGLCVVSVDSVVDGVHVDLALCSPADVGWKALMGALSDLAAMGARPLGALVALCVPPAAGGEELTLGVMSGVAEASGASGCAVIGGDVSSAAQLMVAVTVLGSVDGGVPVARSGAGAGDAVFVTGPCGGSAAGLRALRTAAADGVAAPGGIVEAYRRPVAHAMIDVSDGLALDLHRLADASGVGFSLTTVPVFEGAAVEDALGGGEDYELLIAVGEAGVDGMIDALVDAGLRRPVRLGVLTSDKEARTLGDRELAPMGWQHRIG